MADSSRCEKDVPVVADVDVIVAGAGVAGITAALAAARDGANVMLIDRFGYLGGNMGPGIFSGGIVHLTLNYPFAMMEGLKGIAGELIDRCEGYCDGRLAHHYYRDHEVVSYVCFKMMEENNVQLMLNTFVSDPIMEDNEVKGLFVENKSGRQAVRAKVVIDATGDADVAFRAGADMDDGTNYVHPGMYFVIGGVDEKKYLDWRNSVVVKEEDEKWGREIAEKLNAWGAGSLKPFYGLMRRAWFVGEYRFVKKIGDIGTVTVDHGFYPPREGFVGAQIGLKNAKVLSGDNAMMTELEAGCRVYIFETAQFMRRYVPGFENSYLQMSAPYFHTRGGRSFVAERVVTEDDFLEGARFDDVVFVNYGHETDKVVEGGWDFPYRQLVPKGIKGLLGAGKSAIIQPPANRTRWKCFYMGQVAGSAAAIAAADGVSPGAIDVKKLQRRLVFKYHMQLGNEDRLKDLGLISDLA